MVPRVHVSIHDVSPLWEREVELALEYCREFSICPALLVVPNFHDKAPLREYPGYAARLRELQSGGHEVFLHGYYHLSAPRNPHQTSAARHYFRQTIVSGGEAELASLSATELDERVVAGEEVLREAGLAIDGYVAPAWSLPAGGLAILRARGYRYTEDHLRIYDPTRQASHTSVVYNFASRSPGRLFSSIAFCRLARPAKHFVPTRIAIHPKDMHFSWLRRELRSLLRDAQGSIVRTARELFPEAP